MKTPYKPADGTYVEMQDYLATGSEQVERSQGQLNDMTRLTQFASGIGDNEGAPREFEGLLETLHRVETRVIRLEEDFSVWSYAPIEKSFGTVSEQAARSQQQIKDMGRLSQFASGISDNESSPTELKDLLEALDRLETRVRGLEEDFFAWSYGLW